MPSTGIKHKINTGDTIGGIARQYNSRSAWIIAANKLNERATRFLKVGDVLFVPLRNPPPAPPPPPPHPAVAVEPR
jgi:LysM repeat protein